VWSVDFGCEAWRNGRHPTGDCLAPSAPRGYIVLHQTNASINTTTRKGINARIVTVNSVNITTHMKIAARRSHAVLLLV
jgi:hypothetical protein